MSTSTTVARRYASALLAESTEEEAARKSDEALQAIADTCADPVAFSALTSPAIDVKGRRGVLEDLLKALETPKQVKDFVLVVFDSGRIESLSDIATSYRALFEERFEVRTALVEIAAPMSEKDTETLQSKLVELTGGRIEMKFKDAPELIAGWRARVGNHLIEADLASQAERLRLQVVKG